MAFIEKIITRFRSKFNMTNFNETLTHKSHNKDGNEDEPNITDIDTIDNATTSKIDNTLVVSDTHIIPESPFIIKNVNDDFEINKSLVIDSDITIVNSIQRYNEYESSIQNNIKELPENTNEVNIKIACDVLVASATEIYCSNTMADQSTGSGDSLDNITLDTFSESEELYDNSKLDQYDLKDKNDNSEETISNVNEMIDRNNNIVNVIDTLEENIHITALQNKVNSKSEINIDNFEDLYTGNESQHKKIEDIENFIEEFVIKHGDNIDRSSENFKQNVDKRSEINLNDIQPEYINAKVEDIENILEKFVVNHISKDIPCMEIIEQNVDDKDNNEHVIAQTKNQENPEPNEVICISSEDELNDIDLPISLSDIETTSLSSIETINTLSESSEDSHENLDKAEHRVENTQSPLIQDLVLNNNNNVDPTALNTNSNDNDDSCDGYNSSDFEFITEEEAVKDGLIINYKPQQFIENETCRTLEITRDTGFKSHIPNVAGPSNVRIKYRPPYRCNNDYRRNHTIPQADEYLNLFRGVFAPSVPLHLENKSTNSPSMLIQYQGMGFDMRVMNRQIRECESDTTYQLEAKQNELKILEAYPTENRKRRRRM